MGQFEFVFAVNDLPDETVLRIHEVHDAFTTSYGGLTMVTVTADGDETVDAARTVVARLEEIPGVHVDRCCEDLVTLTDVADRSEVVEDTVRQWMKEAAGTDCPFPRPYHLVSGGVWLWGDVNDWLQDADKKSSTVQHPSQADILQINLWLALRARAT